MDVVMDGALRRFSLDDLPVMPWRNGGGDTVSYTHLTLPTILRV